jgi:hypothetical protein
VIQELSAPSIPPSCVKPPPQNDALIAEMDLAIKSGVLPPGVRIVRRIVVWPGYTPHEIAETFDARPTLWDAVNALFVRLGRARVAVPYMSFVSAHSPRERARRLVDSHRSGPDGARNARPLKPARRPADPVVRPVPVRARNPVRRSGKRTKTSDDGDGAGALPDFAMFRMLRGFDAGSVR